MRRVDVVDLLVLASIVLALTSMDYSSLRPINWAQIVVGAAWLILFGVKVVRQRDQG